MAQRDLVVRVRADVGAYQKAMAGAVKGTDDLARAGLALQRKGLQISRLGDTLTKSVTLPLVALGGIATKTALDFDRSFTTMQTLAGLTAGDVDGLKESVLDLAGETGRAPQELAEALYFLRSSGLDGAEAMEALEVSAKGAAIGLGPTEVIADAVSSAMLGYAESGLSAAEATDVLVATARAGKAEPAELAGQMGRLIPVASELGITFGEVGGAIAALSTKGFNAEQATTALTNVMAKLLKPSQQAEERLEAVGLSSEKLRGLLSTKGLLGTLEELRSRLGQSGFEKFLEDQQAMQGGLALLGGDLEATRGIFEEVTNSVGATEQAFEIWGTTLDAQTSRAIAQLQVGLIEVGTVLAPIAADLLSFAASVARAFGDLPGPVRTAILLFAGLAAAVGPVLSVSGRLITAFGTSLRLLSSFAVPAGSVAGAFNGTTVAASGLTRALGAAGLAGAFLGVAAAINAWGEARAAERVEELTTAFLAGKVAAEDMAAAFEGDVFAAGDLSDVFDKLVDTNIQAAERFVEMAEAAGASADQIEFMRDAIEEKSAADAQSATDAEANAVAVDEQADAMSGAADATEDATSALQAYADTLKAQFDPQFAMIDAIQSSADAQRELRDATAGLAEARATGDTEKITEAEERYNSAVSGARKSVVDLKTAALGLKDAMQEQGLTADEVTAEFVDMAVQQGFTRKEALSMAAAFGIATGEANTLGRTDPNVAVSETGGSRVRGSLSAVQQAAINAGRVHPNIRVSTNAASQARTIQRYIDGIRGRQVFVNVVQTTSGTTRVGRFHEGTWPHRVPGPRGQEVPAILQAGEGVVSIADMDRWGRAMPAAGGFAGGGTVVQHLSFNFNGPVASQAEAERFVVGALRRAAEHGVPITARGRRIG